MSFSLMKTMAKNLRVGSRFTTSRRGYSTPTLTALEISQDPVRNELIVRVEDHLGKEEHVILRAYQEVCILNWGEQETTQSELKPLSSDGSRCRCPDPNH